MAAPRELLRLVETFDRNIESYKSGHYNEAQVRREFIDPLFELLDWDITNKQGHAEAYKDVVHEDAIKIGGAAKAPDYCFRIGGTRKFFLEAKKPSINIRDDVSPAFQLRRYAWSAKLPLSILTDFEEFAAYDCRVKPIKTDRAATARTMYYPYKEYPDRWDEIYSIFSRKAVLKGSFDKYAESHKAKKGTAAVDEAFLNDVETWRDMLARNIARQNPRLTQRELNVSVQSTIDRIIFLRICEDRGIEDYGRLMVLQNGTQVYQRLCKLFRDADARYNSGIFHFNKEKDRPTPHDEITLKLKIDDKVLKDIFKGLYYPESPYEFSVLPADILGQVYEQFLGKVIRLTSGHQAKVEYKPEVKKAGGVYYTPTYIVDYIVQNTVGKLLEGKKPGVRGGGVSKLRILDPACGSGSFLLGAYQYLLDWHRDKYVEDGPKKHKKVLYQAAGGEWRLTTAERKRILLNNIYGVDIDPQAVEVTKLSLLLKVLEGESSDTLERQLKLFRERALPDLGGNVKCGNSLIGPDFYENTQLDLFDEEERYRVNAFNWSAEFPDIINSGGFDAVIGNPPWGGDIDDFLKYFERKFPNSTKEHKDTFKLFIEESLHLLKQAGTMGVIVPSALLFQPRMKDIRFFINQFSINYLINLGEKIFEAGEAPSCVFVLTKQKPKDHTTIYLDISHSRDNQGREFLLRNSKFVQLKQEQFTHNTDCSFLPPISFEHTNITPLGKLLVVRDAGINYQRVGVGLREKGKSDLSSKLLYEGNRQRKIDKMYWKGEDINRYCLKEATQRWCKPDYHCFIRKNEVVHLNEEVFSLVPKILIRQTADCIIGTLDSSGLWFGRSIITIFLEGPSAYGIKYILALLNSTYMKSSYRKLVREKGRVFPQVKLQKVKQLPIRTIDFSNPKDKARHDRMVKLVERMMDLNKKLQKAKTEHDKTVLKRQIDSTDTD